MIILHDRNVIESDKIKCKTTENLARKRRGIFIETFLSKLLGKKISKKSKKNKEGREKHEEKKHNIVTLERKNAEEKFKNTGPTVQVSGCYD